MSWNELWSMYCCCFLLLFEIGWDRKREIGVRTGVGRRMLQCKIVDSMYMLYACVVGACVGSWLRGRSVSFCFMR